MHHIPILDRIKMANLSIALCPIMPEVVEQIAGAYNMHFWHLQGVLNLGPGDLIFRYQARFSMLSRCHKRISYAPAIFPLLLAF